MALRKWKVSKGSNFRFFDGTIWWIFWKEKFDFSKKKIAECSKLAVKCDWKSMTSQNLQNLVIVNKIYGFFQKKFDFVEIAMAKNLL